MQQRDLDQAGQVQTHHDEQHAAQDAGQVSVVAEDLADKTE